MSSTDVIALVAAALIFIAGFSFNLRLRTGRRERVYANRMAELTTVKDATGQEQSHPKDLFLDLEGDRGKGIIGSIQAALDNALRPIGGISKLRSLLLMAVTAAAMGVFLGVRVLDLPGYITAGLAVIMAIMAPIWYVRMETTKRREKFLDSFPDAIDLIVRAVRAGIPTSESIAAAGRELPEPIAGEFRRISQEVAIGVPPDRALSDAATRVRISDFNFFAVTLMLQRETGGNLAETLENLSALLRKRREMRLKVQALTSEGRFTSKVIAILPILVMSALYFLNRDYVLILFTDPTAQVFLGLAVSFVVIGSIIMNRMVNLEI
jgi:tight adherence protein B